MSESESIRNVQTSDSGFFLSPKDLADAIGVSESSLKRWVDEGRLVAERTAGGHRRIPQHEAVRFVRTQRFTLVRPELLGLPQTSTPTSPPAPHANAPFLQATLDENVAAARAYLVQRYIAGVGFAALCDGPVHAALDHVGGLWQHSERGIAIEHRATDLAIQSIAHLRSLLPPPEAHAATAIGFAPSGDSYLLPSMMCAAVLAEVGWRDKNLGPDTPLVAVREALELYQPKLVWCSLSLEDPGEIALREVATLATELAERGTHLVVGGRGAPKLDVVGRANVLTGNSMAELAAFARGLTIALSKSPPAVSPPV